MIYQDVETKMRVHWFAFTMFGDRLEFDAFFREFLRDTFGEYVEQGHGGRGYRSIATNGAGIRIYFEPIRMGKRGENTHVEIPGEACECMLPDSFQDMMLYLVYGRMKEGKPQPDKFSVKRIDLAFDHDYFTPGQWLDAIKGQDIVTLAKREKIRVEHSPFALRDDGQIGTMTVYLGSNEADRMLRVYNKRGPTRVELQMRDERAHLVAIDVLLRHPTKWHEVGMAHLIQYVTFQEGKAPEWWDAFISSIQSADLIISSSRNVSFNRLDRWLNRQVAPAISVLHELEGDEYIQELIKRAKRRNRKKYAALLQLK